MLNKYSRCSPRGHTTCYTGNKTWWKYSPSLAILSSNPPLQKTSMLTLSKSRFSTVQCFIIGGAHILRHTLRHTHWHVQKPVCNLWKQHTCSIPAPLSSALWCLCLCAVLWWLCVCLSVSDLLPDSVWSPEQKEEGSSFIASASLSCEELELQQLPRSDDWFQTRPGRPLGTARIRG